MHCIPNINCKQCGQQITEKSFKTLNTHGSHSWQILASTCHSKFTLLWTTWATILNYVEDSTLRHTTVLTSNWKIQWGSSWQFPCNLYFRWKRQSTNIFVTVMGLTKSKMTMFEHYLYGLCLIFFFIRLFQDILSFLSGTLSPQCKWVLEQQQEPLSEKNDILVSACGLSSHL